MKTLCTCGLSLYFDLFFTMFGLVHVPLQTSF
jgi:hypothetical protein